ncbi:GNAT family N-acetyltransferase [Nereida sp. MMG025]|uniref:GNAT family N-acetyltransferase n=1 Tax=Nereida sp. MMG025 TaxID=2909981 RepID=UPI001EFFD634|nr:GNAT family N-acetyltransferase [Nereida sp. MMG025]MCF6444645.1 GNAT family N-acetyltransferase [Nereida sp. MMG025]
MIHVREIEMGDAAACTELLNHTIALGGTTAYEAPYTVEAFAAHYIGETATCFVALDGQRVVGFQGGFDDGEHRISVGTFADQRTPVKGVGRALIAATKADAKAKGFTHIVAKITEDNVPGLAYYSAVGFTDWKRMKNDATRNGKPIDRIFKRLTL